VIGILLLVAPLLNNRGERAASRRPWSIAVVLLSVIMIGSLWIAGARSPWSPNFDPQPLTHEIIGATSGPVFEGARLFQEKACLNCHLIDGHGGRRGPDLTYVGDRLTHDDIVIRIVNGGVNMAAFGKSLQPEKLARITAFVESRKQPVPAAALELLKTSEGWIAQARCPAKSLRPSALYRIRQGDSSVATQSPDISRTAGLGWLRGRHAKSSLNVGDHGRQH
jgi:mono/diheme cytochrome c family protein